jgi:hypothetical protein
MLSFLKKSIAWALSIITVVFTFVPEKVFEKGKLLPTATDEVNIIVSRLLVFVGALLLSMILYIAYLRIRKCVLIKGRNYSIHIRYGNIFKMRKCKKVIPFDECFTAIVGDAPSEINPNSICGQYLNRYPAQNIQHLIDNAEVTPSLIKSKYQNETKYDPGTIIPNGNYLLLAFTKLNEKGLGEMTRDEYLNCLSVMWEEINNHYGQNDVCLPILGSGTTRIENSSLTQQELLDIMIASYKLSTHKIKLPNKLTIVCKRRDDFSLNKIGESI